MMSLGYLSKISSNCCCSELLVLRDSFFQKASRVLLLDICWGKALEEGLALEYLNRHYC